MMKKPFLNCTLIFIFSLFAILSAQSQDETAYPDIPRIDVHTHATDDVDAISKYLELRDLLIQTHKADLAFWINLGGRSDLVSKFDDIMKAGKGRMLCCISDYRTSDGLKYPPDELQQWLDRGFIGYKIWSGPPHRMMKPGEEGYPYIDNPAHEPTFSKMEEIGMLAASIHIADPCGPWGNRTEWLPDPVEYWKQIIAWRHVLERHPNLHAVCAHCMWAICQDGQIDYLRNTLATFPNFNVDLAATFQYYNLVNRDNLRSFMIEYADRILYGTDVGKWQNEEQTKQYAQRYFRTFQILETDAVVQGSFFSQDEIQGLALPRDVLEKIYYKNAMRIYPRVKECMGELGYEVD